MKIDIAPGIRLRIYAAGRPLAERVAECRFAIRMMIALAVLMIVMLSMVRVTTLALTTWTVRIESAATWVSDRFQQKAPAAMTTQTEAR